MRIEDIDPNFKFESVKEEDIEWISSLDERFSLYGVYYDEGEKSFVRMPQEVAQSASANVGNLVKRSSGGRLRFVTNSPYIAIRSVNTNVGIGSYSTMISYYGYSIYSEEGYMAMISTTFDTLKNGGANIAYEGIKYFGNTKRQYTICFPPYGQVRALYIGIKKGSVLKAARPYKNENAPVVFYGSSITMGGCTTRPGCDYISMCCRDLKLHYLNFGFSGNCKAELVLADYFATLPMSVFVYDYDHNAPNADFLRDTHEAFYLRLRQLRPDLPIVMVTRPTHTHQWRQRREVILGNYERARERGDENVYFIDGSTFFPDSLRPYATVDEVHPNDLGFYLMARKMKSMLRHILSKKA